MAEKVAQSYSNHRKFVPTYHYLATAVLLVNLIWAGWKVGQALFSDVHVLSFELVLGFFVAVALIAMLLHLRLFPLTVQDRVIRIEERQRMAKILPEDLRGRIGELQRGQFVGLRFASDEELPGLVREALDQNLGGEAIKKKIKAWRADHFRC